ncbi:MAG: DNA translocase FtsK [Candidatus Cloacimonetes bacterium]|nr:DNA translocase FtsK [Candidatus Cloacimonadota bacterium]
MTKQKKENDQTGKALLWIKIVLFVLCLLAFISLLTSNNTINFDVEVTLKSQGVSPLKLLFSKSQLNNPLGAFGAYISYFLTRNFGHLLSSFALLTAIIYIFLSFVKKGHPLLLKINIFVLNIIVLFYLFGFCASDPQTSSPPLLFYHIYNFFTNLVGRSGIVILGLFCFIASFELFVTFNPFKILFSFFNFLYQKISALFAKKKKEKIEIDETAPIPSKKDPIQIDDYQINMPADNIYVPAPPKTPKTTVHAPNLPMSENELIAYQKPEADAFLYKPNTEKKIMNAKLDNEVKKTSQLILEKLLEFGIEAKVSHVNVGPIITQYELEPAPGIKVSRFTTLADDISLALKAESIRVQAPIPGRGSIGVEIPNKVADLIYMSEIFFSAEMQNNTATLAVALGKDIAGNPVVTDLVKMPHLLIAGATGGGKSVCIQTIICSLLLLYTPEEVRLAMIDPKRIELSGYDGIPHLIQQVVTEPEEAMNTLSWAVYEMERRYELLQELNVRELHSYNNKIDDLIQRGEAEEIDKLPYIVLIIDEFADLIMTAGREIEQPIARLAQMARAVGIHLILATQRPSIKVITGVIKANFPARIAFRVSTSVDSRVILDAVGADKLLGRGDMLFIPPGKANPERIHGAYLSDAEIEGLVEYLRTQPKPRLDIVMNKPAGGNINDFEYDDELFPEAAKVVVNTNTASVSMLQRHFKIGYARAGRLIDLLEQAGVIGKHCGSKPREVLMTPEDLDNSGE